MTVYLIGAGPGDPGLLTVRGHAILQTADVIIFDRLASNDLLYLAKNDALLIDVGKTPGNKDVQQETINALLVEYGSQGKNVARLKGGDPFVFGRGGEELEACKQAGVAVEVIPGVSSAIAAPAYAGIPVTQRTVSTSFAVITGHETPDKDTSTVNYMALAHLETLIFLMGVKNLPQIAASLMEHGRSPETPAACVEWGTYLRQRVITGTLASIADIARAENLEFPAVVVIGEVAGLADSLDWYPAEVLTGKRFAITEANPALQTALVARGAWVVHTPHLQDSTFDAILTAHPENLPEHSLPMITITENTAESLRLIEIAMTYTWKSHPAAWVDSR